MKLPHNGKIVIIDNEPKEAAPLLLVLSKNKVPFVYYNGDIDLLPSINDQFDDVRIVFLDINLSNNSTYESTIAQLSNTLDRIIKPGTPYVTAIWSNNQNEHIPLIRDLFENRIPQIAPISMTFLNKSDFFLYDAEIGYTLDPNHPDALFEIETRIDRCLDNVDSMKLLIEWENSIHQASSQTIFDITNIIEKDSFWNDNLKHIFYKLAHAQLGKTLLYQSNTDLQHAALHTLMNSFNDRLEVEISSIDIIPKVDIQNCGKNFYRTINGSKVKLLWKKFTYYLYIDGTQKSQSKNVEGIKANNNPNERQIAESLRKIYCLIAPKINAELLISKKPFVAYHPGNVYYKSVTGRKKRKLLCTYFPKIKEKLGDSSYKITDISGFKLIEIECSPACDYSQSKRLRYRFLPGVLYKDESFRLDENLDSIYREIPSFEYEESVYRMAFDYRLFKTVNVEESKVFSKDDFLFRIKGELLIDILAKISSHVNRPGFVTIV